MSVRQRKYTDKDGRNQQVWFVDIKFRHASGEVERVRKDSPVNTRRGAEQYERDIRAALLMGTFRKEREPETTEEAKKAPRLKDFTARFLTYSENNNKHSSVVSKRQILDDHLTPYFGEMRLDAIGPAEIEEFKAAMKKKPRRMSGHSDTPSTRALRRRKVRTSKTLSLKTINNALAVLSKLLNLAKAQNVLAHTPDVKLFKVAKPDYDFLTFDEVDQLIASAAPQDVALLTTAPKTGLRQGELIGLQWTDLDFVRAKLHVKRTIWRGIEGTPKSGSTRTVDLPQSVVEALRAHRHLRGPFVFCQENGEHLTPGMMDHLLITTLKRAGIRRQKGTIGWHDLRHTYGSHLAMRGVPMKVIQELMGHATIEMTMRYAHLSPQVKQDAVKLLDGPMLERGNTGAMTGS
ncbi:phage integrase family site specific recombinase [Myxococcus stipitatus DSM 14675]|uniref:Phage integrase family site specific recombinase n=1 Tax=Myxococcus stipitatus (strain DSM 14675 / JCM 12634 / Mx s8) TaxID=1278073 RepID=L7U9N0_MYXSD|nr:site-specific integrase [Myxococcus stipitatus]AGC44555.1 phage integrase family site specific recombinase [Myxococcus stipitatus DSM 14675]